jgi:hypothetical protein
MNNEYIDSDQLASQEKEKKKKEKKKSTRKPIPNPFVQILNGEFLAKDFVINNLGFVFFIVFLLILLVAKGYYGKQLLQEIDKTQKELDASIAEYVEAKAKLEEETQRIELVNKLEPKGIKETTKPTKVIRIKEEKSKKKE